jgi:hypothetical protein
MFDDEAGSYAAHLRSFEAKTATLTFQAIGLGDEDRTSGVTSDVQVWFDSQAATGNPGVEKWTIDDLTGHVAEGAPTDVYWLTFSKGKVSEICQQVSP